MTETSGDYVPTAQPPSKTEILQSFLTMSNLCMELFDAVEAGGLRVDRALLIRLSGMVRALELARQALTAEYVFSGHAADDLLSDMRKDFARYNPDQGGDRG